MPRKKVKDGHGHWLDNYFLCHSEQAIGRLL